MMYTCAEVFVIYKHGGNMDKKPYNKWVRVLITSADKTVLRQISEFNGSMSEASTVRRLIRDEGRRLGLLSSSPDAIDSPAPELIP